VAASFSQDPPRQTYEAVHMLVDFLNGKPISGVDTGIARIDTTNLDQYMPQQ
jgi:ABC-type sugar transport system substrate-binding protein